MKRVVVVQPYIAAYRVPFFERLTGELADRGIHLTVAHGVPWGKDALRADAQKLQGAVQLPQRTFGFAGRHAVYRRLSALDVRSDALILTQALHALDNYPQMMRRSGPPVGLWGHGATYSSRQSGPLRAAKRLLTNRAQWFFAYTELGAQHVIDSGFPSQRVTAVRNTVDTRRLEACRADVRTSQVDSLRKELRLLPGRTALYIGALDSAKRTPFLLSAAEAAAQVLPGFRLVIAGDGAQRELVEKAAQSSGAVRYVGRVADEEGKALLGAAADVLMVPGAVGLVAVDSMALGVPVVTTRDAAHGPEFDYLRDGRTAVVTADSGLDGYVAAVVGLLSDPDRLAALRGACRAEAEKYSIEEMARRFADGVEGLLRTAKGTSR